MLSKVGQESLSMFAHCDSVEHLWSVHFTEYGRGISMFRSRRDRDLILKGIPDSLRAQVRE